MIIQGVASAAADNVAVPAHQPGDMLIIFVRRAANTAASIPAGDSQVPTWLPIQSANGANSLSMRSMYAIADKSNHLTGFFSGASHICLLVLRPDSGKTLTLGVSSTYDLPPGMDVYFPALTPQKKDGSSWGVRCGTTGAGMSELAGTIGTGWVNRIAQPAGAACVLAVHTKAALVANIPLDTIFVPTNNSPSRAHTIEVNEGIPVGSAYVQPMVTCI